jgi:ABC-2 type transport system permease protein
MIGALRAEWLKITRRPATWTLAAILLAVLVLVYLPGWWFFNHAPGGKLPGGYDANQALAEFYPGLLMPHFLSGMAGLGGAACLALGVLSLGSDYGWGSIHTLTSLPPSRLASLAGRLLALAAVILALDLLLWAAAAGLSAALAGVDGQPIRWPALGQWSAAIASTWLIYAMWCALGIALAAAFRQAVVPIALGLIYMLIVEGLVLNVLASTGSAAVRNFEKVLPGPNASALVDAFGHGYVPPGVVATGPLVGAPEAAVVLSVYLAFFGVVSAYFLTRRDVT